jgi:endogenous inhibitor of DNA gyrase (YacG/DUF329 family)
MSGQVRCPVCDQPFDPQESSAQPFCSQRCKQIDLGRWLGERYGLAYESPYDAEQPEAADEED